MTNDEDRSAEPAGLMTIDEVAAHFKVTRNTIYGWRYRGHGPKAIRFGKHLRFKESQVAAWINQVEREQESGATAKVGT
jgi:excisionase family DNA binding protein